MLFPSDPIVNETRNDVRNQFKPGDTDTCKGFQKKTTMERDIEEFNNSIAWIRLPDGRYIRRHTNQLRLRGSKKEIIVPEMEEYLYEETKERFDSKEMTESALEMGKLPIQDTAVAPPIVSDEIPILRR